MAYSILEGLSALAAFGILIVANTNLCTYVKKHLNAPSSLYVISAFIFTLPLNGIVYLSGFLGSVAVNSELISMKNTAYFILMSLLFTIVLPHIEIIYMITNRFPIKKHARHITGIASGIWSLIFFRFADNPNHLPNAIFVILFFPLLFVILATLTLVKRLKKQKSF